MFATLFLSALVLAPKPPRLAPPAVQEAARGPLPIERLANEPARFATAVDGSGDVDLDGFDDVILGAVWDRSRKGHHGRAVVFSGKTADVLHEVFGEDETSLFGIAVAGAGDTDADGAADFVVGAPLELVKKDVCGTVRVYSGRTGKEQLRLDGQAGDYFGWSVRGAGDVDQDGFADLVVGAPMATAAKKGAGRPGCVRLYSGKKGKLLHEWYGAEDGDLFGASVDSAGDVDGDGSDDVVASAWGGEYVRIYSGRGGKLVHELEGAPDSGCGWIARAAGDTNQTGVSEVVIGYARDASLAAVVLAPKKGKTLWSVVRPAGEGAEGWSLGTALDGAGDVNADGFRDVVLGDPGFPASLSDPAGMPLGPFVGRARAPLARPGHVVVLSGKDGQELQRFEGSQPDDFFGVSVAGAGDCNSDGSGDVLVGCGPEAPFHALLYSGLDGRKLHSLKIE